MRRLYLDTSLLRATAMADLPLGDHGTGLCHGKAQVKLVVCVSPSGLKRPGALAAASPELLAHQVDAAFSEAVDQPVAALFNS